ncbi:MAG: hypothetical protein JZU59_11370 [Chromatium okenii]|jgi:hypothetical protein|uniref:Uncharacterized protein n=2 Tax=Chromatium okenii TaxID=61644 RepID=A0A2S7XQP3_9GAMM|nr:hypothetical protein [Chromatium okenii]PQJ96059.1 hypothetical protein CXB77_09505 [Chromatium okenii]
MIPLSNALPHSPRKPDTATAMHILIAQIRSALPFDQPAAQHCNGNCQGCSMKLLEFLATELDTWEQRLMQGEQPSLADLSQLAKSGWKIHRVLQRNGVVE